MDKVKFAIGSFGLLAWLIIQIAMGRWGAALVIGGFGLFFMTVYGLSLYEAYQKQKKKRPVPVKKELPQYEWPDIARAVVSSTGTNEIKYLLPGYKIRITRDGKLSTSKKIWSRDLVLENTSDNQIFILRFDAAGKWSGFEINER